jgi:preprotein translocase subunit YajC
VASISILAGLLGLVLELSLSGLQQASEAAPGATATAPAAETPAAPPAAAAATDSAGPAAAAGADAKADSKAKSGAKGGAKPNGEEAPGYTQFLPLIFIALMFYLILLRPQQREQKRRQATLNALKKNDKVVTTGGVIGVIADLSADGRFVTLKVDDSTRIRFLRSALHGLLDEKTEITGT